MNTSVFSLEEQVKNLSYMKYNIQFSNRSIYMLINYN